MALLRKTVRNITSAPSGFEGTSSSTIIPPVDLPTQLASGIAPQSIGLLPSTHDETAFAMDEYLDNLPFAYSAPAPTESTTNDTNV